jgi:hypothetical protein
VDARLILNESKVIRGVEYKNGAVVAEVQCVGKITVDDLNRGLQLNQLSILGDKEKKPGNGKPQDKK